MSNSDEKPVGWVIVMLALTVAWLGWAFVAAAYSQSTHLWHSDGAAGQPHFGVTRLDRELALADFLWNSFEQIPRFFSVVNFAFTRRLWLVAIFVGLEVAVYFFGRKMKQVEKELSIRSWRRRA